MPMPDHELRSALLDYFIDCCSSAELTNWLKDIGQDFSGTADEKAQRIRTHSAYVSMPVDALPAQTQLYLDALSVDALAELCEELGISDEGTKDSLYRRTMREVGYREGWLPRDVSSQITAQVVATFLRWYPITKEGKAEKDYYPAIAEELSEVFGAEAVHQQWSIAHGTTLKVDFHVGPVASGIGVEVKMPANNSELQKAQGQVDQYLSAYGDRFILLLLPAEGLNSGSLKLFRDYLDTRRILTVVR